MVLARVLLPASYGTFKQGYLVSQTVALVLPMGLTQSMYYFIPRDPAQRDRYVGLAVWSHLALGVLAAGLVLLGGGVLGALFENPELEQSLTWIAAFTGLTVAGAPLEVAWNASGRIGPAAIARLSTDATRSAALVMGTVLVGTAEGAFAGMTFTAAARAVFAVLALGRAHGLRGDVAALRRQVAYALPFGLAFVLIVPQQQLHSYAVAAAVSAAAFAVYSVGTFQLPLVDVLYAPVSELLQIGLAAGEGAGRPPSAGLALFHEAVLQLAFVFMPLAGLLYVCAPLLIELLFSRLYLEAAPILRVAVMSIVLSALPLDAVMRARAQNRFMLALSALKLAATIPLVLGGLGLSGPIGALAGWLVAEALSRAVMLGRAASLFEVPLRRVLPVRQLASQLLATLFGMAVAWVASRALSGPPLLRLGTTGLAFAAAYLGLSWAKGWLPPGWISLFRARRARSAGAPSEP
jgi:O-antigen/teichoic acid export membrane protein